MSLVGFLVDWTQLRKASELEDMSVDTSKNEKRGEQRIKKNRISKDCGAVTKNITRT